MHYYQFNIGDYIKHTMHLSPIEDITYRRLLDMYYDTEAPIPNNIPLVSRRLRIEAGIVKSILTEFFEETEEGYRNYRADAEIASYHGFLDKQKANGSKGGRPKKTQTKPTANPNVTQNNPKQEPLTTNHKPINNIKRVTPEGVSTQVWDDFLKLRKQKRAAVTDTVIRGIEKEANKAGLSLNDALEYCCVSGWQSFNSDWYANAKTKFVVKKDSEAPWVKQNREWFESATGRSSEKDIFDMEITPRILK